MPGHISNESGGTAAASQTLHLNQRHFFWLIDQAHFYLAACICTTVRSWEYKKLLWCEAVKPTIEPECSAIAKSDRSTRCLARANSARFGSFWIIEITASSSCFFAKLLDQIWCVSQLRCCTPSAALAQLGGVHAARVDVCSVNRFLKRFAGVQSPQSTSVHAV